MYMFRRTLAYCVFLLLVPIIVLAQEAEQTFTLADGIRHALSHSHEYQVAKKDVELADAKIKEARAAFLPRLSLDTSYTFNGDLPTIVLDSELLSVLSGTPDASSSGSGTDMETIEFQMGAVHNILGQARVSQQIFTWGQLSNTYKQAVLGKLVTERKLIAVHLDTELKVQQAFYGVLLAEAFVKVSEQSLAQVEKRHKLAAQQKAMGATTRLEVIRANVQVVNSRSQLIQARNQHKLAVENFKLTLGLSPEQPISLSGSLQAEIKDVELDAAITRAVVHRPEIQQLNLQERISEAQVKVAKAGDKPKVSSYGSYVFNDNERQSLDTSWSVGMSISFPIFDGLATRSRVKQARVKLDQVQTNKDRLIDSIKLETKSAAFDLAAAAELIAAQEGIVEQAAEGLRIANVKHEAGMITGVELTDVELSYTQTQVNRLQAIHDYMVATARYRRAIALRLE